MSPTIQFLYAKGQLTLKDNGLLNIIHFVINFILPHETQRDILNLIFNTFGGTADLPVVLTTHGEKVSSGNLVVLIMMKKKIPVVIF